MPRGDWRDRHDVHRRDCQALEDPAQLLIFESVLHQDGDGGSRGVHPEILQFSSRAHRCGVLLELHRPWRRGTIVE